MADLTNESAVLRNKVLFFLSLPRHDAKYTSTPWQIAVQLAGGNRVFFMDHPYTFMDLLTRFREPAVKKRLKAYSSESSSFVKDGVTVILPPFVWPVNFLPKGRLYNFFSAWNHRLVVKRANRVLKAQAVSSVIYVNSFNFYFQKLHAFLSPNKELNVYHCIDPMVKGFTLRHGPYLQAQAARKADLIISTAPALQQRFRDQGFSKSFLVPNAANFKLFAQASTVPLHPKLAGVQGKVMGFFGNIERRTDFTLLRQVLDILHDWRLVLAGPVEKQYVPREFMDDPRVHFTGAFTHDEAPSVVKRFDVAIIPFRCDEAGKGIYPLKLYEYLAAGKPVVSTNFNPDVLGDLKEVIQVADSPQDFAKAVLMTYATDSEEKIQARITTASQHTWENRAKDFSNLISQELQQKAAAPPQPGGKTGNARSLKERIKNNPRLKKLVLSLIFRRKPNGSRVKWYVWLWLIFPKYFRRGVSWGSRLDLSPFNKYKLGKYSRVEQGVVINNGMGDVIIHDEVHTGIGCIIIGPVTLHKHVGLSQYVRILGMHHGSDVLSPHHHQPAWRAPVILEEDAFIGTGTVIMGKKNGEPLVLGRYCRVGANALVTTDIPPYSVAVGNPAKVVRVWDFEKNCWVKPGTQSPAPPEAQRKVGKPDIPVLPDPLSE
ncbi:glycosyltransferase [Fulvivirgaceae bacterium PWU4]|uniref:Glycosyltransferase n=1 Tax=Chryseosolibacter histidini TaxID=2782349 RepID=A0AAP2DJS9_9BACT|nr:glycosyltransferase [Chryseosolibacter histidini]MBT1697605.1 glycosyltransferase [Chryseosolibacter histidini]